MRKSDLSKIVGKTFNFWKILEIVPRQEIGKKGQTHPFVRAQCLRCGRKFIIDWWSIKNNASKQCTHCRSRTWDIWNGSENERKIKMCLYQTWRKYRSKFGSDWKNNFFAFYTYMTRELHYEVGKCRLGRFDRNKPFSHDNVKLIINK